jgi:hypothetical protein
MAAAPLILAIAGTGAGVYGAVKQTQAQNEANEYNAQVNERNAAYAEVQAKDAEARGEGEVRAYRQKVRGAVGEQKSVLAKSGVVMGEGSASDILASTQKVGEMDAMKIKANTAREAQGLRMQARNMQEEARMERNQYVSPWESGGVSLLSGGGQLASRFIK